MDIDNENPERAGDHSSPESFDSPTLMNIDNENPERAGDHSSSPESFDSPTVMNIDNENPEQAEDLFTEEQHARLNAQIPQPAIDLARLGGDFVEVGLGWLAQIIIQQLGPSNTKQYETLSQLGDLIQGNPTLWNSLLAGAQDGNFNAVRCLSKVVSLFTPCTL